MKAVLESTGDRVELDGVPCQVWRGATDAGLPVTAYVHYLTVDPSHDPGELATVLADQRPPRELAVYHTTKLREVL